MSIKFWNRRKSILETESVYGGQGVSLLYGNPFGFALTHYILSRKFISRAYGALQSTALSGGKVAPFIKQFGVNMEEFEAGPYRTFNDFFIRKFLPGRRPFPTDASVMGAPCEARYFAFANISEINSFPVKGLRLDPMALLANTPGRERFVDGPCLLARLCPVDYHRFHFPDSGLTTHFHAESGVLHSVNPLALARKPDLFLENERQISLLETKNFGSLAYVEVGALMVGKIVQSHSLDQPYKRGDEKGYFLFGASTVIVYGEKGAWRPESDLLEHTAAGREVLVELGQPVARSVPKR